MLSSAERFKRSVGSYHDFVDACEAHDPDRAERVIHDSMRWAVDLIAGSLPSEQEPCRTAAAVTRHAGVSGSDIVTAGSGATRVTRDGAAGLARGGA